MIRRLAVTLVTVGCKPRVCGDDPFTAAHEAKDSCVNPACAGMILTITDLTETEISKPRVCGDDPARSAHRRERPR